MGSSAKDGHTISLVDSIMNVSDFHKIDLNDYQFSYYDYEHQNKDDDFLPLMRRIIPSYDTFLFATPVYWYAMSGIMKVFFDRLTDLLDIEKDLGRQLRKKNMAVITCSNGDHLGEIFWYPFIETAKYLGMRYSGNLHTINRQTDTVQLEEFVRKIAAG